MDDCGDGSDEQNCRKRALYVITTSIILFFTVNFTLVIGLSVGVCILVTLIGISTCVILGAYWTVKKKKLTASINGESSIAETSFTSAPSNDYYSLPSLAANAGGYAAEVYIIQ